MTGASSGIGMAMAGALAGAGARVVLLGRDAGRLAAAAEGLGDGAAAWVAADLAHRDAVRRAADEAARPFGDPDILFCAAGVNRRPPLVEVDEGVWDETMAVNLVAPHLLAQRFAPAMVEQGWGRIVNVASQQSVRAFGNSGAYGVSKAAVVGLTRSQAEAWSRHGVCCNAVAPGLVRTPMTEAVFSDPSRIEALRARTLAGRNGEVSDFCGVAVFLASRASNYVTGQLLFVDGGFSTG